MLKCARNMAVDIIKDDPELEKKENYPIARHLDLINKYKENWGLIS